MSVSLVWKIESEVESKRKKASLLLNLQIVIFDDEVW
jgi:hypothetical protein